MFFFDGGHIDLLLVDMLLACQRISYYLLAWCKLGC